MKLTDTMTSVAMFLGDNGEGELSRRLFAEIERLLAQERELMKKRCMWACERVASDPPTEEANGFMEGCHECEDAIRQLDLTKDLAASSREEGGDARDSRD